MPEYFVFIAFLLGLLLGSFANVVIVRLPLGKSVVRPRSHCPLCGKPVVWYDNIPVLSFLILKAKCRKCGAPISWRYPLVELLMAVLFAAVFWLYGLSWTTLEYWIFIFGLVTVTFIDFDHMILPDEFTLGGTVIGLVGAALSPEREFLPALFGVLMGGGFLWAVAYIYFAARKEEGMGGGDIKLLAWIGSVLTWHSIPFVILASSVIGSIVGLLVMMRAKTGLKTSIPFGPYLALAALLYLFVGREVGDWYLSLFLPALLPSN